MNLAVTNVLLAHLREQLVAKVDHAQFGINGVYTDAPLNEKKISPNGTVTIGFYITASSGTVTECRLLDADGNELASRQENIVLQSGVSAVYYFFTYDLYELPS